jgi:hypothetical protein
MNIVVGYFSEFELLLLLLLLHSVRPEAEGIFLQKCNWLG